MPMAAAVLIWLCVGATKQACDAGTSPQCAYTLVNPSADTMSGVISKDGTMLAMATKVGTYVANIQTGDTVWSAGSSAIVQYAAFSPDGRYHIKVVDLVNKATLWQDTSKASYGVDYSPDGTKVVSGYDDGSLEIRDAASGTILKTLTGGQAKRLRRVRYSPDGKLIVSAVLYGSTVGIWDAATGDLLHSVSHTFQVNDAQFSPDSTLVASTSKDLTVVIWKIDGTKVRTLTMSEVDTTIWGMSLVFSRDGTRLFIGLVDTIEEWDVNTGTKLSTLDPAATTRIRDLSLSSDGRTLVSAVDNSPKYLIWDLSTPAPLAPSPPTPAPATPAPPTPSTCGSSTISGMCSAGAPQRCTLRVMHATHVLSVAHSPDGAEVATGAADGVLRVFSTATGALLRTLGCVDFAAHDVAYSPDGVRVVAGGAGGRAVACNATSGDLLLQLEDGGAAAAPVRRVRFSGDGRLVVAAGVQEDATRVHRVADGGTELVVLRHTREVGFVAGGSQLATVQGEAKEATRLFAVASGKPGTEVASVGALVTSLSLAGEELARGMGDGTVRIGRWDGGDAERLRLEHGRGFVSDVQHSPDGRLLASAGQHQVRIWAASSGVAVASLPHQSVTRMSFSADGTQLATAGDDELLLWDVAGL